jgi:acyl-coenzyme A synthetase/AMP-(fatty) acid ligase
MKDGCEFNETELVKCCSERLTPSHVPQEITEVKEIPKTGSGKVLRR